MILCFSHHFKLNSDIPGKRAVEKPAEGDTDKLPSLCSCLTTGSTVINSDRYFHNLFFKMEHALSICITVSGEVYKE